MKLYTSGCSFTHGHNISPKTNIMQYNDYVYESPYKDNIAWPWQLEDKFDLVFNHGLSGSGLKRLNRRLLEFLSYINTSEYTDWIFILQVSQAFRQEFIVGDNESIWTMVHGAATDADLNNTSLFSIGYDSFDRKDINSDKIKKSAIIYHNTLSFRQQIYDQLKELHFLVSELDKRSIKYLITGLDIFCYDIKFLKEYFNDSDITSLCNTINTEKFIGTICNDMCPNNEGTNFYDACGHPNKNGHVHIANYIYNKITEHGYI